jgi:peptidoglycan/LPS O-acetylase OafA/YrhL
MRKENNFDFLRLLFATFVIITHSYTLSGINDCDWLCQLTNGQLYFSYIGVRGFFIISGFLVFQSLERSKNIVDYFWKRCLRIFPALAVVLVLTIILAPIVYENKAVPYLESRSVWMYVPNNLSLYNIQYGIKGVFEKNPHPSSVNGSLWTIAYEFIMYILLSFLIFFRRSVVLTRILLAISFGLLVCGNIFLPAEVANYDYYINSKILMEVGAYFLAGSVLASLNVEQFKYFKAAAVIAFSLIIISVILKFFYAIKFIAFPLVVLFAGTRSTKGINNSGKKIGDLSYGVYIYAFPVQQTLFYFFKLNYLSLMLVSIPISFALAYLSWHLIESKALKLKKYTAKSS